MHSFQPRHDTQRAFRHQKITALKLQKYVGVFFLYPDGSRSNTLYRSQCPHGKGAAAPLNGSKSVLVKITPVRKPLLLELTWPFLPGTSEIRLLPRGDLPAY